MLTASEIDVLSWLVRTAVVPCFPAAAGLPGLDELGFDGFLARFRAETTPLMWTGVVLAALLVQLAPPFTLRRLGLAGRLPPEAAVENLERLAASPFYLVRQSVFLVKMVGGLCWGAHDRVRARIGLEPYPIDPGSWRSS